MRIGVLTGGGDCPGLNAAIRAVVRKSIDYEFDVLGIQNGWLGLLENQLYPMNLSSVSGILPLGGTILSTSRTNPAKVPGGFEKIAAVIKEREIDAIVAIGGDDTLSVALELNKRNIIPAVGAPKTMDNDVALTDYCIGFDSAVSTVTEALDKLHTTAHAHHRVMVVEVMGRDTGWVALYGGLAGGADWIMIPEVPSTIQESCQHLIKRRERGKDFSIIVVAEGVVLPDIPVEDAKDMDSFGHVRLDKRNVGHLIGLHIERITGFETRVTVLGHLQRGGPPTVFDRILATRLGVEAVKLIKYKRYGEMAAFRNNEISAVKLEDALKNSPKKVPIELYQMAHLFY